MQYREFAPIPPLARYVRCIWIMRAPAKTDGAGPERILPDGLPEIVINRADAFAELRPDGARICQPDLLVAGQLTRPLVIQPTAEIDLIGIRLQPTGLHQFLRAPMRDFTNERIQLSDVANDVPGRLKDAAHRRSPLSALQAALLCAVDGRRRAANDDAMRAAALIRQSAGRRSVASISRAVGVSARQLQRRFNDEIGVSTKAYARIARFDGLVRAFRAGFRGNWARLAQRFGYHDQSHLIREFRGFAGQSPTEFAASQHVMPDHFTASPGMSDFYNPAGPG